MDSRLSELLIRWEKPYIRDQDLNVIFSGNASKRYDVVKFALSKGFLTCVRRGLYLIGAPYNKKGCEPFGIAQDIYGPSYISFESALSYYGWIPEAAYGTTCACIKRAKVYETPLGIFRYFHTPTKHFFLNVAIINQFAIAEPWKAIADMIYSSKRNWKSIEDLIEDLRVEEDLIYQSDQESLLHIANHYASPRVRAVLSKFYKDLENGHSNH